MGTWMALRRARLDDRETGDPGLTQASTISTCSFQDDVSIQSRVHERIDFGQVEIESRMRRGLDMAVEEMEVAFGGFRSNAQKMFPGWLQLQSARHSIGSDQKVP